jgi:predicted nucleic acid-binding protein
MGAQVRYLLDTSAVIAGALPSGEVSISVVTLGELRAGMFTADDPLTRAQRSRRFVAACRTYLAHEVDANIAERFGEVHAFARFEGRLKDVADHIIIATAAEHRLTLFTADTEQGKLAEDLSVRVEYAS